MATEKQIIEEYKTRQLEAKAKIAENSKKKKKPLGFFEAPSPKLLKTPDIARPLSKGQQMLNEMFSGNQDPIWGTGNNLPILHRTLISGGGLIKHGDNRRQTGGMFGLR